MRLRAARRPTYGEKPRSTCRRSGRAHRQGHGRRRKIAIPVGGAPAVPRAAAWQGGARTVADPFGFQTEGGTEALIGQYVG